MPSQILFVIDTTGSMSNYISSLKPSILQLSRLIMLLGTDTKIGIIGYKDHSDKFPIECINFCDPNTQMDHLNSFIDKIRAEGGDDTCEASKTAVNRALDITRGIETNVLVIHFTDAPPHCPNEQFRADTNGARNNKLERDRLGLLRKPFDWIELCKTVHSKKLQIVTLFSSDYGFFAKQTMPYYALLGHVILIEKPTSENITRATIDVILSHFDGSTVNSQRSYEIPKTFIIPENEIEFGKKQWFPEVFPYEYYPSTKVFGHFPTVNNLVKKFKENNESFEKRAVQQPYRDLVYKILDDITNDKMGIMSLTYNPIFGSLWRNMCAFNRIDGRSVDLTNKMNREMAKLGIEETKIMKEWLEESYNREEDIREIINSVKMENESKVFIIDMKEPVTKRQLMDVMRGTSDGASTGKVIRFLSTVQTLQFKDIPVYKKENYSYIPVELKSCDVMAIISHLIAPGIIMSTRPASIISILACLALDSSSDLYRHASNFLEIECGKWIDIHKDELPDNYCFQFIHIINQLLEKTDCPMFLTPTEDLFYKNLTSINNVMRNLNKYLIVSIPYTAKNKLRQQYDHTLKCKDCGHNRSFTVMHSENQCGPCYLLKDSSREIVEKILCNNSGYEKTIENLVKLPDQFHVKTNLFDCSICTCYYSVISIDSLNVKPKCHFCRTRTKPVYSKCVVCTNRFIDEPGLLSSKFEGICGQCTYTKESFEELKISIGNLFKLSPGLLELFGISKKSIDFLFMNKSVYKGCTSSPRDLSFVKKNEEPSDAYFWGNAFHDHYIILQTLEDEINHGETESECLLCYEKFPLKMLKSACGNCTQQLCENCAKGWYSQNSPGNVVLETYSRCPFCKSCPKFETIKNYNRVLCQFNNRKHIFNSSVYEAWCLKCGIIDEYAPKECANDMPDLKGGYMCQVCKIKEEKLSPDDYQKTCPGCNAMTYKSGGCNHITCPMENCGTHWCWKCRHAEQSSEKMYDHLNKKHGGLFDFERNYDSDDDDDDDDYY